MTRDSESPAIPIPWPLSSGSTARLRAKALALRSWLLANPDCDLGHVGRALAERLEPLEHRAVVIVRDYAGVLQSLEDLGCGRAASTVIEGRAPHKADAVFAFAPQGSEWEGMGVALLDSAPAFARTIGECEQALAAFVDWSLSDVIRQADGAPGLERIEVVQPTLMAISLGLARLAQAYGVTPAATLGYCVGEIMAAHVAGALSLEDAARVASRWSQAQGTLSGLGEMASVIGPR
jgi:acyl transferase domain-containing protein